MGILTFVTYALAQGILYLIFALMKVVKYLL
jgi:hypothetical protein